MGMWRVAGLLLAVAFMATHGRTIDGVSGDEPSKGKRSQSCTPKYPPISTMCQYQDDPSAQKLGVNQINQIVILAEHNKYRRLVRPRANAMQKMYWDDEIAVIAQKWAQTCPRGHDTNENRKVPGYGIYVGQNWAAGFSNWAKAIKAWYDEVNLYQYGQDPQTYLRNGFAEIGHYTQVVRDVAARVGCGYAECPNRGKLYVCNYAFGNPFDFGKPYERGPTCSDCPKSCKNKLCDCRGTICMNGGTLDPNTCTCQCPNLWAGKMCEKLSCPPSDPEVCGAPWGFQPHRCTEWMNVPEECPHMCGVCKPGDRQSPNNVLPPANEGRNNGRTPQPPKGSSAKGANSVTNLEVCASVDADYCGKPQPVGFEVKHCQIWKNVPVECPAMCGKCKPRCGEKTSSDCQNGGALNGETCQCDCVSPFGGENCRTLASCPSSDTWFCGQNNFSPGQCETMSIVRKKCPIMCGLCEDKCPGMGPDTCQNGGTLGDNCRCICTPEYKGQRCEKFVSCPRAMDENWCSQFSPANCKEYFNFPTDCPHMCNAC